MDDPKKDDQKVKEDKADQIFQDSFRPVLQQGDTGKKMKESQERGEEKTKDAFRPKEQQTGNKKDE